MYTFDSRIRYSETDENAVLTVGSLINYFQDCSTFQTQDCGAGLDWLNAQHLAWVLSYWQIEIFRLPRLYEQVRVGTVPYALKGFMGLRNYYMDAVSEKGQTPHPPQAVPLLLKEKAEAFPIERLAVANSVWALMDMEKMLPARITPEHAARYTLEEKLPMEYLDRKVKVPEGGEIREAEPVVITHAHLDTNRHVNNGQYVRMAMNAMGKAGKALRIRAEYKKQAHPGDTIVPVVHAWDDGMIVDLRLEGESCCVVEVRTLEDVWGG